MSQENVEIVRDGLGRFAAKREFPAERVTADSVWDMSNSVSRTADYSGERKDSPSL